MRKRSDAQPAIVVIGVIKQSNMSVTNLSFSTKFVTLCFDILPGKERRRENTGGTGDTGGSGGGRKSRKKRKKGSGKECCIFYNGQ